VKLNKLASTLQRCTWLIDQRAADHFYPMAERFLAGESVTWFENNKEDEEKLLEAYGFTKENDKWTLANGNKLGTNQGFYADAPADSVAIINIEGTLMQDDYCGSVGTETIGAMLMDALASPSIIGVVMKINSPGGTVEGTAELEQIVSLVSSLMAVEVFTNGQLCSAAYWVASPCRITASSGTVEIGSIGTAGNLKDYSKTTQVITHYMTADASFDKNKDGQEALKGNYTPIKTNIINPTNDIFLSSIIDNRDGKLQLSSVTNEAGDTVIGMEPLTGQVYLAQKAIDLGLIDAIGNLQSVLDSVRTRATSDEFSNNQNQNNMGLFGKKTTKTKLTGFATLDALKTKKAEAITEEEIVAANEELELEGFGSIAVISATHFAEANANADALDEGLTSLNAALGAGKEKKTLAEAITAVVAEHKDALTKAATYGKQPGEIPTQPVKEGAAAEGGETDPPKEERKLTSYDRELLDRQAKLKKPATT
jgi:ClpP class serine protease